ncbi:MAG: non-canonical purine NTP pyrophosphatase [Patescibacteria group bacterium]
MQLLIATSNPAKVERVRKLLADIKAQILTPVEAGITPVDIEEGSDIAENAVRKARAYLDLTKLPILGLDSAFVISGETIDPAKVKRNALGNRDEDTLTPQEIGDLMINYYKKLAQNHGGQIPAYWQDAIVLVLPDGSVRQEQARRDVTLTTESHGAVNPHVPLRSMYIVAANGKYATEQSLEDEMKELRPVKEALERLVAQI